jgi:hypothetical protein
VNTEWVSLQLAALVLRNKIQTEKILYALWNERVENNENKDNLHHRITTSKNTH